MRIMSFQMTNLVSNFEYLLFLCFLTMAKFENGETDFISTLAKLTSKGINITPPPRPEIDETNAPINPVMNILLPLKVELVLLCLLLVVMHPMPEKASGEVDFFRLYTKEFNAAQREIRFYILKIPMASRVT